MNKYIVIALLGLLTIAGCGGKKSNKSSNVDLIRNPNSAEGYDNKQKMPAISFVSDVHDFGRISAGENISYSFKFTNTGNADLLINSCDASCGCTVADFPRHRIAPGETGYVTVSFNSSGLSGMQMKEVTVIANTQPSRTRIRITAEVR